MLTVEQNERLTRVGPGSPMGELMRRYWQPIAPYSQLLDDEVMKIRILGEDLVLFRTKKGALGLIGDRCAHRRTELQFGFPDDNGLRCCYHGWMYSPDGSCLDTPLEAPDSTAKNDVRLKAYPVRELGGLVWAYMGPQPAPLLPPWDLLVVPNAIRQIGVSVLPCNWLQCHENTGDPAHSVYLHGHYFKHILEKRGELEERAGDQTHTLYARIRAGKGIASVYAWPTKHGIEKGMKYSKALGADRDRTTRHSAVIFPFITQVGGPGDVRNEFQIRVPMDDTHTYHVAYGCYTAPANVPVQPQERVPWYEVPLFDEQGRPNRDFVLGQDMLAWRGQGEITDRSEEYLGRTDNPIVVLRKQLEDQMRIVEDGGDPLNTFRDAAEIGEILHGADYEPGVELNSSEAGVGAFRAAYHKGFFQDDADRYGPAINEVMDLMRRIEESRGAASALA